MICSPLMLLNVSVASLGLLCLGTCSEKGGAKATGVGQKRGRRYMENKKGREGVSAGA